jgi:putative drug exporter of the RND superfamily
MGLQAHRERVGPTSRTLAWIIVRLRFLIVPAWIAAAWFAVMMLPSAQEHTSGGSLADLIPHNSPAVQAETQDARAFGSTLLSRVVVVQRDPSGLSTAAQERVVRRAAAIDQHRVPGLEGIAGALPVINTLKLFPSSRESSTTAITYLYFRPTTTAYEQLDLANQFVRRFITQPDDHLVGVTGVVPAQIAQTSEVYRVLPWIEAASVVLVIVIMGLAFRSVGAPLLTLFAAGLSYLLAVRVVGWAGQRLGTPLPPELEPLIVVLLLGIVTDYTIFFLAGVRQRLADGEARVQAAQRTTAEFLPIIFTAGLTVAAGTAALLAARLTFFRAMGPGMAITVLIGLLVAITVVPASLAILGHRVYWPSRRARPLAPVAAPEQEPTPRRRAVRTKLARLGTARPVGVMVTIICMALLVAAASQVGRTRLDVSLISGLPSGAPAERAARAAGAGFAPGIIEPGVLLVSGSGVTAQRSALDRLQAEVDRQPGVAAVIGPRDQPPGAPQNAFLAADGAAARFVVIGDFEPLGGPAIEYLRSLQANLPGLMRDAGLGSFRVSYAGDTAIAVDTISRTQADLVRVAIAMILVNLLLLSIFLRALVAPLYLVAASVLALLASLGITTWVFQGLLGQGGITYYVPFAAAVLLVSLGSDYNIFLVGRIWEEARVRPMRDAVAVAGRRATRTIGVAGLTLAAAFALLAMVPLLPFREFAFAMCIGVLIDAFLVRRFLVPSLITVFGRSSHWPSRPRPLVEPELPEARAA